MKKLLYLLALLVLLAGSFLLGSRYGRWGSPDGPADVAAPRSDAVAGGGGAEPVGDIPLLPPGSVAISPVQQQLMGVKAADVRKSAGRHTIRILGRVAVDETRVYAINAVLDGWITEALPVTTGTFVRKNQTLSKFYSPDFLSAEQALLFALSAIDRAEPTGEETPAQKNKINQFNINVQQYKDTLRNLGMSELQIEEIARTREFTETVNIASPADGFVIFRNVSQGLRFDKGAELFRIADLSRVWVLADTYENEAQYLRPGDTVKVTLTNQEKTFMGRVSKTLPQFDPATRTLKVRLEVANPGYILKPDMFVDVELPISFPPALVVAADAILDSGLRKTVFVDRGNGFFEPREVETGRRLGERVEVTRGLAEGERIVVAGTFLIDSESRMSLAAAGMYASLSPCPICSTPVATGKAAREGRTSVFRGKTYYFSTPECKERFDRESRSTAPRPAEEKRAAAVNPKEKSCGHD